MKNEKLISAWNAAAPDAAAEERMRAAVMEANRAERAGTAQKPVKLFTGNAKKIWVPLAACLALAIALTAVFAAGGFGGKKYTVTLGTGETVTYKKTPAGAVSGADIMLPYDVTSRDLTAGELSAVSPLLTSGFGTFRSTDGALVRFEGYAGDTKIVMAAPGVPLNDTVTDETPTKNEIGGVPVLSGYCIANNGGKPVTIFSGEFTVGEITVYAERTAKGEQAQSACSELTDLILQFIDNGEPTFAAVTDK